VSDQAKALIHVFFAERAAGKVVGAGKSPAAAPPERAAVVGAGTMGRGIAMCFANAGIPVLLKDTKHDALENAMKSIESLYESSCQKGRITADEIRGRLSRIHPQLDDAGFDTADIIVEAAFENLDVKRTVFAEVSAIAKPDAILATNTSYLNIDEIAGAGSHPERAIGMHFFSPANVMRLVEVVPGNKTEALITESAVTLAKRLGKLAVIAGNCPGFIGNRMLSVYRREAHLLIEEGASPSEIDSTLEQWGMAMGPFAVQDLAGIDISMSSRHVFAALDRPDTRKPRIMEMLYAKGRLGQKTGAGWYRYDDKRKRIPDPAVDEVIEQAAREQGIARRSFSVEEIVERTIYALINEGTRILEESFAARASDIDLVYINGYGFPSYRGGPMHFAEEIGLAKVLKGILAFRDQHGANWEPSVLLTRLAQSGGSFSDAGRGSLQGSR
jgi:3-hydroxyacyl-CoA dehydrogenase